jgi:DNA helicase HerA-like ATPase
LEGMSSAGQYTGTPPILHNPHMLVLGSPGTGKSTLVKTLIFRSESLTPYTGTGRPPAFIIIDPAGEYAEKAGELEEQGVKVTVIDLCRIGSITHYFYQAFHRSRG